MKTLFKLLGRYVVASLATELLVIMFNSLHMRVPTLNLIVLSPLLPMWLFQSLLERGLALNDALTLGLFLAILQGLWFRTLEARRWRPDRAGPHQANSE